MQTKLRWKRNIFSNSCKIYSNDQQTGKLKENTFSQTANGELDGKEYTFKTKGFFKQHTEIIDSSENKVIGDITYSNWMTRATIKVDNKTMKWKYGNIWNTKWSISNSDGIDIKYAGTTTRGKIESNTNDAILLLSGLYVTNYYWQITITIIIAAFIPIWTTIFT